MKKEFTIKELTTHLKRHESEAEVIKMEIDNKIKELEVKNKIIFDLKSKIKTYEASAKLNPKVSEHALLRYLERVKGIDIKSCEQEILNKKVLEMIETLGGNGSFPNENFKLVMKDNVVVTITT
jgi:hypothetical protein